MLRGAAANLKKSLVKMYPSWIITVIGLSSINTKLNRDLPLTEVTPESLWYTFTDPEITMQGKIRYSIYETAFYSNVAKT